MPAVHHVASIAWRGAVLPAGARAVLEEEARRSSVPGWLAATKPDGYRAGVWPVETFLISTLFVASRPPIAGHRSR